MNAVRTLLSSRPKADVATTTTRPWLAIAAISGIGALLMSFKLSIAPDIGGQAMFQTWMTDWLMIWAGAFVGVIALALPLVEKIKHDLDRNTEFDMLLALSHSQPSFRQELMAIACRDLDEETVAVGVKAISSEGLDALGGLEAPRASALALQEKRLALVHRSLLAHL
jgi:hypothetical protein